MSKGIILSEATHARFVKSAEWTEAQARTKQAVQFEGNRDRAGGRLPAPQYQGMVYGGVAANQGGFFFLEAMGDLPS